MQTDFIKQIKFVQGLHESSNASNQYLILLPLRDGDETHNSWKPLLNTSWTLRRLIGMVRAMKAKQI